MKARFTLPLLSGPVKWATSPYTNAITGSTKFYKLQPK
jgi:hypothetical protein